MSRIALPLACVAALIVAAPVRADDETFMKPKQPRNQRPTATIAWAPAPPHSGDAVTFSAAPSDPEGDPVTVEWDINGDGRFESAGPTTVGRWTSPGTRFFNMRLADSRGAVTFLRRSIEILNASPVAAFTVTPTSPLVGSPINFASQSTDPDGGQLDLQQAWDLDGDGAFDDATGPSASATLPAGDHVVRLRVSDLAGNAAVSEQHVVVAVSAPITANSAAGARLLSPFPVVRLRGRLVAGGVDVSALTVWGPRGAHVSVRCRGGGCPRARVRRTIPRRGSRVVSLRAMRRRLHAGARIEVRVTQRGLVGKYVGFLMRSHGEPLRHDRCLAPGSPTPRACR